MKLSQAIKAATLFIVFIYSIGLETFAQGLEKKRDQVLLTDNLTFSCSDLYATIYSDLVKTRNFSFKANVNNELCYSLASGVNFGCLSSIDNQSWFIIEVVKDGNFNVSFSSPNGNDLDAAIWGKIPNNDLSFYNDALSNSPIACDYSISNPTLTIQNAFNGELYLLLVTNYSNVNTTIFLESSPVDNIYFKYSCPQNISIIESNIGDYTYKSAKSISSIGHIENAEISYSAGKLIELKPGFEVKESAVFMANIDGCVEEFKSGTLILQPGPVEGKDLDVSSHTPTVIASYNNDFFDPLAWTASGSPNNKRVFIEFDLSTIPSNSIIDSAYLDLYFSESLTKQYTIFQGHSGQNDLLIKRILSPWEQTAFTWNNQPPVTELNRVEVAAATTNNQDYPGIDVKRLVQDMLVENYGFSIVHKYETPYKITCFTSSNEVNPAIRPRLRVFYHHL